MNAVIDDIKTHLEYLAYTIESAGDGVWAARHDRKWTFMFTEDVGGILFRAASGVELNADVRQRRDLVNALNRDSIVIRFFVDEEEDINQAAWWPNIYERHAFSNFMEAFDSDIRRMLKAMRQQDPLAK